MKIYAKFLVLLLVALIATGCETFKAVLGTSIRHLEEARETALSASYDCDLDECFDAVLSLSRNEAMGDPLGGKKAFEVFSKDRIRSYIVLMGIEGNIETTEVGVFLTPKKKGVDIDISSLSSSAQERAATAIFNELNLRYNKI